MNFCFSNFLVFRAHAWLFSIISAISLLICQPVKAQSPALSSLQLPGNVKTYIDTVLPGVQQAHAKYGIPISVAIAQSAQESGWDLPKSYNDYFNILYVGSNDPYTTGITPHGWRAYGSSNDAFLGYGYFVTHDGYYTGSSGGKIDCRADLNNPLQFLHDIAFDGFDGGPGASSDLKQGYYNNIKKIMDDFSLTNYDQAGNAGRPVLIAATQWLSGQGVDAYDNGSDVNNIWGDSYVGSTFVGLKYQCVELPQRLYTIRGWYNGSFGANAVDIYDAAGRLGMEAHSNGSGYIPVPGDMIVLSGGTFGHVAVVDKVDNNNVNVVEQNWPGSGDRFSFGRSGNNGSFLANRGSYVVRGVVHSPNNHNTNGGNPPPTTIISESDSAAAEGAPGFFRHGTPRYWNDATDSGDGGHMLWTYTNGSNLDNIGDWRPNLPDTRNYEIFVFIPGLHATTHKAHYEIYHADGRADKVIDQYAYTNVWVSLGTYRFNAGTSGILRLVDGYNEAYDGKTKVGFDTAKWEARDAPDTTPPTVTITSGQPTGVATFSTAQRIIWHIDDGGGSGLKSWGQAWDSDPGTNQYTTSDGYLDLPTGTHTLNVHVIDNAGNQKNWTFGPYTLQIQVGQGSGGSIDQRYVDCYNRVGQSSVGAVSNNYVHSAASSTSSGGAQDFAGGTGGQGIIMAQDGASQAFNVHGNIWNKYSGMSYAASPLGFPTSDEADATTSPQGTNGRVNHFDGGVITSTQAGTFAVYGPIFSKYANSSGSGGPLGFPSNDLRQINIAPIGTKGFDTPGLVQEFEGGPVYDSKYGTHILPQKFLSGLAVVAIVRIINGTFGFPTSDEQSAPASPQGTSGSMIAFQHGAIYNTSKYGTYGVYGDVYTKYVAAGASGGSYGSPVGEAYAWNGGMRQNFEAGYLTSGVTTITHVLWNNYDGTASIWNYGTVDGSFSYHNYGPYPGWTAKAIAEGGTDGKLRVLWVNTSGKVSLWSLDNTTGSFVSHDFGPYSGWYASSLSVGADNTTHVLWNNYNGTASLWNYDAIGGNYTYKNYGPYSHWAATAVADGKTGNTRLLWANVDGQASLWSLDNTTGSFVSHNFGPYNGWTVNMLSVGADDTTHVSWVNYNGALSLWNYDAIGGNYNYKNYGPYSGWTAKTIADGADGKTRVLWVNTDGTLSLGNLDNATGTYDYHNFGPYNGWTAAGLSAGQ